MKLGADKKMEIIGFIYIIKNMNSSPENTRFRADLSAKLKLYLSNGSQCLPHPHISNLDQTLVEISQKTEKLSEKTKKEKGESDDAKQGNNKLLATLSDLLNSLFSQKGDQQRNSCDFSEIKVTQQVFFVELQERQRYKQTKVQEKQLIIDDLKHDAKSNNRQEKSNLTENKPQPFSIGQQKNMLQEKQMNKTQLITSQIQQIDKLSAVATFANSFSQQNRKKQENSIKLLMHEKIVSTPLIRSEGCVKGQKESKETTQCLSRSNKIVQGISFVSKRQRFIKKKSKNHESMECIANPKNPQHNDLIQKQIAYANYQENNQSSTIKSSLQQLLAQCTQIFTKKVTETFLKFHPPQPLPQSPVTCNKCHTVPKAKLHNTSQQNNNQWMKYLSSKDNKKILDYIIWHAREFEKKMKAEKTNETNRILVIEVLSLLEKLEIESYRKVEVMELWIEYKKMREKRQAAKQVLI